MKKRIFLLILAIITVSAVFTACAATPFEESAAAGDMAEEFDGKALEAPAAVPQEAPEPAADRANEEIQEATGNASYATTIIVPDSANKIILTKTITTKTKEFDADLKKLIASLETVGGYIENSSVNGVKPTKYDDKGRVAEYAFRVPRQRAAEFVTTALTVGEVYSNQDSSKDITGEYVDTEARLKTLRIRLERLQDLESKATKMADIVTLEQEIQNVTYEIENLEGQKRVWDNLVDYATVNMMIYEVNTIPKGIDEPKPIDQPDFGEQLGNGFMSVLNGVLEFFKTLALILIAGSPVIIPVAAIVLIIIFSVRAGKKKRMNDNKPM